jgi:hypothetical protein
MKNQTPQNLEYLLPYLEEPIRVAFGAEEIFRTGINDG